jgi:hypothetical protein
MDCDRRACRAARIWTGVALLAVALDANAFSQDKALESALGRSEPRALALLPASGYKDGVAGFFRAYSLYVVANSARAWCQDTTRGVLPPGCYVEFHFQQTDRRGTTASGVPCGLPGRWHRAVSARTYRPTPGAYYSIAIANGNWEELLAAFEQRQPPAHLSELRSIVECELPRDVGARER